MNYHLDFGGMSKYWPTIIMGVLRTLGITAVVIVTGTPVGVICGLMMRTRLKPLRYAMYIIVDSIRALPVIVLIFICYYLIPLLPGVPNVSATVVASVALSLYLTAFQADVIRGGIASVPQSYVDAGLALGMGRWTIFHRIELRFVIRTTLPTTAMLWIGMLKNSSLASFIGVIELTHVASTIASNTFRSVEVYLIVGMAYVVIVMPFALLARRVESAALRFNAMSS